jgi:hypothetical protein
MFFVPFGVFCLVFLAQAFSSLHLLVARGLGLGIAYADLRHPKGKFKEQVVWVGFVDWLNG